MQSEWIKILNMYLAPLAHGFAIGFVLLAGLASANAAEHVDVHADDQVIEEVIVWGRAERQKGEAMSASEGLVGYANFETRPLQRVGELAEVVPGMVATQHSGEGKANQYYLRGMNLDHGTDFSAYFEGMPVNLRAHAHGQGYLDLNFLIPEIVSTVRYAKGPYAADRGDFSTAGTSEFALYDRLDHGFVDFSGGGDNYHRFVGAGSIDVANGHWLGALEITRSDGPWDLPTELNKTNVLAKYSGHWRGVDTKLVLSAYDSEWNSTDQVPERWVDANVIDRFGFVDPTLGGESQRFSLIAGVETDVYSAGVYASRYALNLFNNFTYLLEDPINGDQVEQQDRRWIYGGHADYRFPISERSVVRLGAEIRYDDVADANLYQTTARVRRGTVRDDSVEWRSAGTFAELTTQWTDSLRTQVGLRFDYSDYEVDASIAANSGSDSDQNVIPNFTIAYEMGDYLELYGNWGRGFHSNDVRGATIQVDPLSGDPVEAIDIFVDQQGAEIGLRMEGWQGLSASVTYFWLESDSELLFVGDSGATEPSDGSERMGTEVNVFWNLNEYWTFDVNASFVDSEFTGVPSGQDSIPNAHDRVIGAGIVYAQVEGLIASLRMRHFAEASLVEDDSVGQDDTTVFNAAVSYDWGALQLGFEVLNIFDSEDDDIAYYFESRLPGELAGVEDVHFHPVVPFTVRASVRWEFGG